MRFTAGDIAAHLGGKVIGDRTMPLTGFQAADRARAGDLTFAENRTFFERAEQSAASAIIVDKTFTSERKVLIRVDSARTACAADVARIGAAAFACAHTISYSSSRCRSCSLSSPSSCPEY